MKKPILPALFVLLVSCGVNTTYIGKSYAPAAETEIFFDWKDVPCAYETMGYVYASPKVFSSLKPEKAQAAIEREAREKGADAVVFTGVSSEVSNPSLTLTEKIRPDSDGGETRTLTSTRSETVVNTLKATFIKYKK